MDKRLLQPSSPGELTEAAAIRRLKEELAFETKLEKIFDFTYKAAFENGLIENEFDHVFAGTYNGEIKFNRNEVQDVCFRSMQEIEADLQAHPNKFTAWFLIAFPMIKKWQYELTTAVI
jgi:isopentenyl-diphosphate delta-isomerase